nr:hypothetical protein [Tanacetum cinerariifolium]
MTTLAEHMKVAGADNRPPMLEKTMYTSWASCMLLYIKGKEHRRMMLNSVLHGPLIYPTIKVDGVTRPKTYEELSEKEKLQDDCDLRAMNIVLQGLPQDIYALVNHNQVAKQIWNRVKLLMQGNELSYQEREYDPIASLNKSMEFLSIAIASCFPTTNNQLRSSSNPRNQATVQDGRVIVQQVQGRQNQGYAGNGSKSNATTSGEKLALLADLGVAVGQDTQTTMPLNAVFQTDDLDAFYSNCDKAPGAYSYYEQSTFYPSSDIKITSDSNIISYTQYLKETESVGVQNNTSSDQQNVMIMSVFDAISNQVAKCTADNLKHKELDASLTAELESYKERVKQFEERQNVDLNDCENFIESQMNDMILSKNAKFAAFQKQTKEKEDKYIDEAIDLEKQKKELENIVYKVGKGGLDDPKGMLYGSSRSPLYQVNLFRPCTKKEDTVSLTIGADPTIGLRCENQETSFQKLKNHLANFDIVVKVRTTPDAITEGAWGFKHTKEVFMKKVIPFLKSLKELFNDFDKGLNLEINELKMVFEEIKAIVDQCSVDKNIHTAVNSLATINDYKCIEKSFVDEYNETLELKAELAKKNEMVDKLDLQPLPPRIKNNSEAHLNYLKVTQEHTDTLNQLAKQAAAPRPVDPGSSPLSTTIDTDAPLASISSTQEQEQYPIITQESSSNVQSSQTPIELLGKWTKNHPLANIISNPSRPISIRKQLQTDAMSYYFDAFLTSVEPNNFKKGMLKSSWIESMQEEIHEFKRLQV